MPARASVTAVPLMLLGATAKQDRAADELENGSRREACGGQRHGVARASHATCGGVMSDQSIARVSAHVVVLGNEKGGSGKSTTAIHLAVALMQLGQRVATIDLDSRQRSLTRYVDHRRAWARRAGKDLLLPTHHCVAGGNVGTPAENEASELAAVIESVDHSHDFVVIDTPGADSYLSRLAHCMADTLVTPLNDSFVDLDVIGRIDPMTLSVVGESHYAAAVREARRRRRSVDGSYLDWVVVRNRLALMGSRNKRLVGDGLRVLATQCGFRCVDGLAERLAYREFFPCGLTAVDDADASGLSGAVGAAARSEVMRLLEALRLPLDARGRRRAATRAEWFASMGRPLELHDLIER